ncbi:lysozyme inhibitor LprI family protein [Bacillus timonensis]|uniref:lysozyme inhibitor LprI family protein n=1 Tax=Bacillus timonensis TaxID=1033734 RepID=UPI000287B468|nr:lysozyme inhibitor LprI family protein [Bacillus timonensis]
MKKDKILIAATLLVILLVGMSACSKSSDDVTAKKSQSEYDKTSQSTDVSSQANENSNSRVEDGPEQAENTDNKVTTDTNIQEDTTINAVTVIEGRRNEFLKKLDNIQKEVDALPDKKGSDKGATNAMKNYYGISYEKYDEALNEIYALLKKELSSDTMQDLKTEQIKWIEQKEEKANEERLKYEGGTFENVAFYISLYESTKERCYELVNEYMTD